MDKLVGETLRTGISSLAELGKYYRDFIAITTFLIVKNRLATPEQSHTFTHGFLLELWSQVSYQLQLKFPDHFPNNPYTLEQIHDATCFVLHSTVVSMPMHALTIALAPKTKSTELSTLINIMKQVIAMLDNQSEPSTPTNLLLVSMPPTRPVATFQLSLQECIQEIEKELSALCTQVCPQEQKAHMPPATHNCICTPAPTWGVRCTLVPTPEFDDTPHIVFMSCAATPTSKTAHGLVFPSVHPTAEHANVAIFALAPSATIAVSTHTTTTASAPTSD